MPTDWKSWLEGMGKDAAIVLKKDIADWLGLLSGETDEFLMKQHKKVERYIGQLADGRITAEEFKGYLEDIRRLTELQMLSMSVATKAKAQKLVDDLSNLLLSRLMDLL